MAQRWGQRLGGLRSLLTGSTGSTIRAHNLRAVLFAFLRQESVSRAQLAQITGLSSTSITNLVRGLIRQGVLAEVKPPRRKADRTAPQPRGVGRPQRALRLVPDARFAVGVHIDVDRVYLALTDLYGRPRLTDTLILPEGIAATDALQQISERAAQIINSSGVLPERILGLGMGASGLVEPETGINRIAPGLGWQDVPLVDSLSARLRLPVAVENNVRAMALAETFWGAGQNTSSLAFIYGRVGVGAGFTLDGQLYRGANGGAGEIGHLTIIPVGGETCRCGNSGCLETLISEGAISRAAAALDLPPGDGPLIERLLGAARSGHAGACDLLAERARYLGIGLATVVSTINPEVIVLGGFFARAWDVLEPVVRATLHERTFAGMGDCTRLEVTRFNEQAGVIGAAALALQAFFFEPREV
jgi:predicted NBD/HSP70 family sugar kinase